jgi:MoxR-like ATPase
LIKAGKDTVGGRDPSLPGPYIQFGPLGQALRNQRCRPIVLIDEIDKADIDFPNDLLTVLEEKSFTVNETGKEVKANPGMEPIIFITSNDEKELPDAFLRRCVFYYIQFPDPTLLKKIINSRFKGNNNLDDVLLDQILARLKELREQKISATKEEGTSELLDWVDVLLNYGPQEDLFGSLDGQLPYLSVLVKNWEKHKAYLRKYPATGAKEEENQENE